jgi:LuxR family maltose regulon positive regulatory protein
VVRAFNSLLTGFRDDLTHPYKISHEPLENLPGKGQFLRSLAAAFNSVTHILSEDLPHALKELEQAAHISQEAGNWMGYLALQSQIAGFYMIQGKLRAADAKYKQMLEFVDDDQSAPLPVTGLAYIGKGDLLREWNELDAAMRYLEKGAELIKTEEINILYAYINLAKARQAQGDVEGALEEIQRAVETARQFDISSLDDRYVSIFQARLWITQGNLVAATGWMQKRGLDRDFRAEALEERGSRPFLSVFLRGLELNTLARLHLASGQSAQALEILDPLVPSLEKQKFISLVIEALVLQALACQAQAQGDCALSALERALALAEPEGYMRIFLDEGEPMRSLILAGRSWVGKQDRHPFDPVQVRLMAYMDRLLSAFPIVANYIPQSKIFNQQSSISTPLTARELEVLQRIAAGLSNQEIADQMILALSTVKSHVHNIYRKLGVTSRTLAAARARELHLL